MVAYNLKLLLPLLARVSQRRGSKFASFRIFGPNMNIETSPSCVSSFLRLTCSRLLFFCSIIAAGAFSRRGTARHTTPRNGSICTRALNTHRQLPLSWFLPYLPTSLHKFLRRRPAPTAVPLPRAIQMMAAARREASSTPAFTP